MVEGFPGIESKQPGWAEPDLLDDSGLHPVCRGRLVCAGLGIPRRVLREQRGRSGLSHHREAAAQRDGKRLAERVILSAALYFLRPGEPPQRPFGRGASPIGGRHFVATNRILRAWSKRPCPQSADRGHSPHKEDIVWENGLTCCFFREERAKHLH